MDEFDQYVGDRARRILGDVLIEAAPFFQAREALGRSMEDLVQSFKATFPTSRLTLYAPKSPGELLPRGLYWGTLQKPRGRWDRPISGDRRPRAWTKHKGKRLTSVMAGKAGEGALWERYRAFDTKAEALQTAHAMVWPALKRVRNVLAVYGGPPEADELLPPLPSLVPGNLAWVPADVLLQLWRVAVRLAGFDAAATRLSRFFNVASPVSQIQLRFTRDREHPFGRFLWCRAGLGSRSRPFTDQELRVLRVPYSARRNLFAFARQATELEKHRHQLITVLRGIGMTLRRGTPTDPSATPRPSWVARRGIPCTLGGTLSRE